jgi:hypothetical protein
VTTHKTATTDALLDAHVHFVLDQIGGESLQPLIESELDAILAGAGKLKLNDCVTRKMIKDTALAYAADLELGAGIPELVGDVARALYAHDVHAKTAFGDLLGDEHFGDILDKALELKSLREKIVHEAVASPLYASFASDLLYNGIKGYLSQNAVTRNIPGASSMMKLGKSVLSKATPNLEASIEESLKKYIGQTVKATSKSSAGFLLRHANDDTIRELAQEFWARIKPLKVSALREDVSGLDVEEGFVTAYEFWRDLRRSAYYRVLIGAGIDAFFDKYGDSSLAELLDDLGIDRAIMLREAMRFAPHVIKALNKKKLLEPVIRRNLARFYHSAAARVILDAK